jgi:hypothetical protein
MSCGGKEMGGNGKMNLRWKRISRAQGVDCVAGRVIEYPLGGPVFGQQGQRTSSFTSTDRDLERENLSGVGPLPDQKSVLQLECCHDLSPQLNSDSAIGDLS